MIPKFRAWYTPFKGKKFGQEMIHGRAGSLISHAEMSPDKYVLMQSTGLKDKNGVEIFEGDILKLDIWQGQEDNYVDLVTHDVVTGRPSKYIKKLGEVKKDMFGGLYVNDFYLLNLEIADKYQYEIIGNIYQNPELLEGE